MLGDPRPSVTMQQLTIIVDRQFNKPQPRDGAMLVVLEPARFHLLTSRCSMPAHCLSHHGTPLCIHR